MSRHGYHDDCDDYWSAIRWRGAVTSAIRGRRGQAFLRELLEALDAMPEKRLVADVFVERDDETGSCDVCVLEALAQRRGVTLVDLDPEDDWETPREIAKRLGIAWAMVKDLLYENDDFRLRRDDPTGDPDAERWKYMRELVATWIKTDEDAGTKGGRGA